MMGTADVATPTAVAILVDGDDLRRSSLRERLEAEGYLVRDAPSAAEAVALAAGPSPAGAAFRLPEGGTNLEQLERDLVVQALERCGWNQTRAGTLLGINRDQVRYRIEKFGLTAPSTRTTLAISPTR